MALVMTPNVLRGVGIVMCRKYGREPGRGPESAVSAPESQGPGARVAIAVG